jgi:HSP20 family protein
MNNLVRFDPFAEIDALQKQLFGGNWLAPGKPSGVPTTDVYVDKDQLVVEAHLPNYTEEDINVEVENGFLVLQAERHEKEEDKAKKYVVRESSMSFYRRIQLPERANTDQIDAHLDEGVLKVSVPLTPLPEPKKVKVLTKKTTSK